MHFLQSKPWEKFQKSLGRKTFRQSGDGWGYLTVLERGTGNSRLYCPYGPYAKNQAAFEEAIDSLISLGKKHRVTFVRVEPTELDYANYLQNQNWKKTTYQKLNPELTRVIDLTQPEDELIANMAQPTRNCYRNYQKKGVTVTSSDNPKDIEKFLKLIHEVAERTGLKPHSDDYFRAQANTLLPLGAAKFWYATFENQTIATALTYDSSDTRYYAHAAASALPEHRKLNAGTAIVAEAIVDAKKQGLKSFDLFGVAPDDAPKDHPWAGFTRFKQSFGGQNLELGGTWELPINPLAYWLYRIYQTLRKK